MKTSIIIFMIMGLSFFASCGEKEESQKQIQTNENSDKSITTPKADTIKIIGDTIIQTDISTNTVTEKVESSSLDYSKKPLVGQIVSLRDVATGSTSKINKEQAKKLAEAGEIIVFKSSESIYFVYNEDGSFAGKKLAGYANNAKVGMIGKVKIIDGFNIFICTLIEGM